VKINVLHFCPICKRDVLVGKNNIKTIWYVWCSPHQPTPFTNGSNGALMVKIVIFIIFEQGSLFIYFYGSQEK
jgi:hypothetical protein